MFSIVLQKKITHGTIQGFSTEKLAHDYVKFLSQEKTLENNKRIAALKKEISFAEREMARQEKNVRCEKVKEAVSFNAFNKEALFHKRKFSLFKKKTCEAQIKFIELKKIDVAIVVETDKISNRNIFFIVYERDIKYGGGKEGISVFSNVNEARLCLERKPPGAFVLSYVRVNDGPIHKYKECECETLTRSDDDEEIEEEFEEEVECKEEIKETKKPEHENQKCEQKEGENTEVYAVISEEWYGGETNMKIFRHLNDAKVYKDEHPFHAFIRKINLKTKDVLFPFHLFAVCTEEEYGGLDSEGNSLVKFYIDQEKAENYKTFLQRETKFEFEICVFRIPILSHALTMD